MSDLLDTLCGPERLKDILANERAMHIVTHEEPGLQVVEVWPTEPAMEPSDEEQS